ncbi:sensor histidine kinase [Lacibacter luteus]|nr:GAF domain-containing protein [Lacibacter luteus]
MLVAELPKFEDVRLADLHLYHLLDSPPEKEFDELRELAARICNCPVSMISLVDRDRQWYKSQQGFDVKETGRDVAFCSHAILHNELMIVEDMTKDIRFDDHPFVTGEQHVRFYAGAPIVSPTGQNLGTICVIDQQPRTLNDFQKHALEILSNQVTKLLELRLKTKIIEDRAARLISLKDQALQEFIAENDQAQLLMAKELHENIAQDLAAIRLYLTMADNGNEKNVQFIAAAQKAIRQVMDNVKNLSYNFSPSTLETSNLQLLMEDLLEKNKKDGLDVELLISGNSSSVSFLQLISYVRITEAWLQVLLKQPLITKVNITITIDAGVHIVISDNAADRWFADKENEIFRNALYYRVIGMNGHLRFVESANGLNELHVQLPIVKKEIYSSGNN